MSTVYDYTKRTEYGRDAARMRAAHRVLHEEYESRAERYDTQLGDVVGVEPTGKTTDEKVVLLREWREARFQKLVDAVYARRGWTPHGVPTLETLRKLQIALPEVVAVVKPHVQAST